MQSVRFQGNSGSDGVGYYCQIIVTFDFSRPMNCMSEIVLEA